MRQKLAIFCLAIIYGNILTMAETSIALEGGLDAAIGSHEFAPFYMSANRFGTLTQSKDMLLHIGASDSLDYTKRFDWAWGVEVWGGASSSATYERWNTSTNQMVYDNPQHPARIWLQQLYGELKYRCLYLSVGMKNRGSALLNNELSSGDLTWSGNTRGIPEARIGFNGFQDIPFTNKWVQADLALAYGFFADKDWIENHYSYKRGTINLNTLWNYKRLYLRSNPEKPFSVTFGLQAAALFGGTTYTYVDGRVTEKQVMWHSFKDYLKMLLPIAGESEGNYVPGDHKGSWDFMARYRLRNNDEIKAYFEWYWEDGSSLLKNNGWDGLWGIEYKSARRWWIDGAVVEYLDFTHQSGPLHYDPNDWEHDDITTQVRGRDNYYDSWYYRAYCNYGSIIGTPMVMGLIYDTEGRSKLKATRVRGIHLAIKGSLGQYMDYQIKFNHRKAWGDVNTIEMVHPLHANSWYLNVGYNFPKLPSLRLNASLGIDNGNMPSKAAAFSIGVTYSNNITLKKK